MSDLERRLRALGGELVYPATPRLDLDLGDRPARGVRLRALALVLAVLVVAVGAVLAFSPGARSAFLELFRLQGATVELTETLPDVELHSRDFGLRVTREESERRIGFPLLDLGRPDAVFVRDDRIATLSTARRVARASSSRSCAAPCGTGS